MTPNRWRIGLLLVLLGIFTVAIIAAAGTPVIPQQYSLNTNIYPHTCWSNTALCMSRTHTSGTASAGIGTPTERSVQTPVPLPLPTAPPPTP